jgi:hypothetical protein
MVVLVGGVEGEVKRKGSEQNRNIFPCVNLEVLPTMRTTTKDFPQTSEGIGNY